MLIKLDELEMDILMTTERIFVSKVFKDQYMLIARVVRLKNNSRKKDQMLIHR